MHRFDHFAVGVANGIVHFSGFETDGPLWTGQGPRTERRHIRFDEAFVRPPVVHVSLTMWDISVGGNQRADVQAIDIDVEGFVVEFRTWGDTRVARVRVGWMAIGAVRHVTDFDVD